ncbi:hypothetical protein N7533_008014 [Penicillium manginii]|uniref:uncharacterized protein n=1 Tax=Penicillium manginii TaxID=203109 RepID=UPI002549353D|nr:uncharacterized protein N7533_008014 [Penicillium manginii]KAJ5750986.1 hypothetical protein N7533_008014 [Penicillium manginii]
MLGVELHSRGEYAKSQIAGDEAAWTALSQGRDQFYCEILEYLGNEVSAESFAPSKENPEKKIRV